MGTTELAAVCFLAGVLTRATVVFPLNTGVGVNARSIGILAGLLPCVVLNFAIDLTFGESARTARYIFTNFLRVLGDFSF